MPIVKIYIPSFKKIVSGIQKIIRRDAHTAWRSYKPTSGKRLKEVLFSACLMMLYTVQGLIVGS
jgi:hypothetical protein